MRRRDLLTNQTHTLVGPGTRHYLKLHLSKGLADLPAMPLTGDVDLLIEGGMQPQNISLILKKDSCLKLQVIAPTQPAAWIISISLEAGATMEAIVADFGDFSGTMEAQIALQGPGSSLIWHLASLARSSQAKTYSINFTHEAPRTSARMINHGILEDQGRLTFTGRSHIHKGAVQSETHQEARILVFDDGCVGRADPILAIDDNEVAASHAATVGKINEEHLFYLKSRGLDEAAARRLITMGYLRPAIGRFTDKSVRDRLSALLQERL